MRPPATSACGLKLLMHAPLISTLASSSEETSLVAAGEEVDKSLGVRVQVGTIAAAGQVRTFVSKASKMRARSLNLKP